jgi:hypothetical protein
LSFAAPFLKGGHEVIAELRDQSRSARTRIRQAPDAEGVSKDQRRGLERYNEAGEKGVAAFEPPRRGHLASTQPVGKGLAMKKFLGLAFVAMLFLALAAPAYAGRGHGGGFHGGHHGGSHHGSGFHGGCCWGGVFVGGVFVGSAFAYPYYYGYPYYAYPYAYPMYAEPAYQPQTQVTVAPSVPREVYYTNSCYHLQGDGVTVAYSWIWVLTAPPPSPGPPSR